MARLWIALALASALIGCRKAPEPTASHEPGALPTQLAQRAEFVDPSASSAPSSAPSSSPTDGPSPSAVRTGTAPPRPLKTVGSTTDKAADAGPTTPAYADLRKVELEEDGQTLRVTVTLATTVPETVPDGELIGLGVNLYLGDDRSDSDYQLFVDGQPEGWFAYLATPQGHVDYPGRLLIAGDRIVFEVPMSSVGGDSTIAFDAFLDWSTTGLIPQAGEDHAPDSGQRPISR